MVDELSKEDLIKKPEEQLTKRAQREKEMREELNELRDKLDYYESQNKELTELNEDELVGFIARKLHDVKNMSLDYNEIKSVLDLEFAFLNKKGLIELEGDE